MPYFVGVGKTAEGSAEEELPLDPGEETLSLKRVGPGEDGEAGGIIALDLVGSEHAVEADGTEVDYLILLVLFLKIVRVLGIGAFLSSARHSLIIFIIGAATKLAVQIDSFELASY
jgi:hypothetical protein